jgi:arginyl-tRNA--protein-N-Asp/Glu arginylyltransferase
MEKKTLARWTRGENRSLTEKAQVSSEKRPSRRLTTPNNLTTVVIYPKTSNQGFFKSQIENYRPTCITVCLWPSMNICEIDS